MDKLIANDRLAAALHQAGVHRLAHIQEMALRGVRASDAKYRPGHKRGKRAMRPALLIADMAGSGKTLAYLIPAFERMMKASNDLNDDDDYGVRRGQSGGGKSHTNDSGGDDGVIDRARSKCPRVIVLVPTAELAVQTLRVVRRIASGEDGVKVRSLAMTGGGPSRSRTQRLALEEGVDVVVGTPARIANLLRSDVMRLDALQSLVVDEVDVLVEDGGGFGDDTDYVLNLPRPGSSVAMLVSATVSKKNMRCIASRFNNVDVIAGPRVHRVAAGMEERLIDCGKPASSERYRSRRHGGGGGENDTDDDLDDDEKAVEDFEREMFMLKAAALPDALGDVRPRGDGSTMRDDYGGRRDDDAAPYDVDDTIDDEYVYEDDVYDARIEEEESVERRVSTLHPRSIVFCNTIESCRRVESLLKRRDKKERRYRVLAYHAAVEPDTRDRNLKEFMRPVDKDGPGPAREGSMAAYRKLPIILVCTDRLSRGLDLVTAGHAVLFDFPRDPHEYVRRVGRVCRGPQGGGYDEEDDGDAWRGKVTMLAVGRQVELAREIVQRNEQGALLHPYPRTP